MKTITREELHGRIAEADLVLLEALPETYYRQGHLPGARLFPVQQARELAPNAAPRRDAPIVVYCASETCKNSDEVAKLLGEVGYSDVRVYKGGKADRQAAGLPLKQ